MADPWVDTAPGIPTPCVDNSDYTTSEKTQCQVNLATLIHFTTPPNHMQPVQEGWGLK